MLQPGVGNVVGVNVSASITQTGTVPVDAQSLQLKVAGPSPFEVSLAGQRLNLIPLGSGANYTLYAADISALRGQMGDLTITAMAAPHASDYFDSIIFSTQAIPEPSPISLFGLGALCLARASDPRKGSRR